MIGVAVLLVVLLVLLQVLRKLCGSARGGSGGGRFARILDRFKTVEEVQAALRDAGLESSNLVVGIDYTKSNLHNGARTFGGKSLHHISSNAYESNPYERTISVLGRVLAEFDDDNLIPAFGFGDVFTSDKSVFPFYPNQPCQGFEDVLRRYREITPGIKLSGVSTRERVAL